MLMLSGMTLEEETYFYTEEVIDKLHIRSMSQRDGSLRGLETDGFGCTCECSQTGFMVQAAVKLQQ